MPLEPPPPPPGPAIPPPGSRVAALILRWILDTVKRWKEKNPPPTPMPPDMAALEAYGNQLTLAGVIPAEELPA